MSAIPFLGVCAGLTGASCFRHNITMFIRSRGATAGHGVAMTQTFDYSSARIGPGLPAKPQEITAFSNERKRE
jgi:hypothetical protein